MGYYLVRDVETNPNDPNKGIIGTMGFRILKETELNVLERNPNANVHPCLANCKTIEELAANFKQQVSRPYNRRMFKDREPSFGGAWGTKEVPLTEDQKNEFYTALEI